MDKNGDGVVTVEDLKMTYNVRFHPAYINGWCSSLVQLTSRVQNLNASDSEALKFDVRIVPEINFLVLHPSRHPVRRGGAQALSGQVRAKWLSGWHFDHRRISRLLQLRVGIHRWWWFVRFIFNAKLFFSKVSMRRSLGRPLRKLVSIELQTNPLLSFAVYFIVLMHNSWNLWMISPVGLTFECPHTGVLLKESFRVIWKFIWSHLEIFLESSIGSKVWSPWKTSLWFSPGKSPGGRWCTLMYRFVDDNQNCEPF